MSIELMAVDSGSRFEIPVEYYTPALINHAIKSWMKNKRTKTYF